MKTGNGKVSNGTARNGTTGKGLSTSERKALLAIANDGTDPRGMLVMWLLSRSDSEDPASTAQMLIDDIEDSEDAHLIASPLIDLLREVASIDINQLAAQNRGRRGGRAARLKAKSH